MKNRLLQRPHLTACKNRDTGTNPPQTFVGQALVSKGTNGGPHTLCLYMLAVINQVNKLLKKMYSNLPILTNISFRFKYRILGSLEQWFSNVGIRQNPPVTAKLVGPIPQFPDSLSLRSGPQSNPSHKIPGAAAVLGQDSKNLALDRGPGSRWA